MAPLHVFTFPLLRPELYKTLALLYHCFFESL